MPNPPDDSARRAPASSARETYSTLPSASPSLPERYHAARISLAAHPRVWLVTGAAGFIASNLVEALLSLGQHVVGLDNFTSGTHANIDEAIGNVPGSARRFRLIRGDIRDRATCARASEGVDFVLHHAAVASVGRSMDDPIMSHDVNVTGTLNVLLAARDAGVRRVVYASSSAVYGNVNRVPQTEHCVGAPLSPYAATKQCDETYASVVQQAYGISTVGLRYFNVYGRRQDPNGDYAAVIPRWILASLQSEVCTVYGDGETTRDFCHVDDVVQANLLAATADSAATGAVYNVGRGQRTSLNELFQLISRGVHRQVPTLAASTLRFADFRAGDVRHSFADISRAQSALGFAPTQDMARGLDDTIAWYVNNATALSSVA